MIVTVKASKQLFSKQSMYLCPVYQGNKIVIVHIQTIIIVILVIIVIINLRCDSLLKDVRVKGAKLVDKIVDLLSPISIFCSE